MAYPPVVIVNDKDEVVGSAPLHEAWEHGLIHRLTFVVIENTAGQVLLHKRAPGMELFPNRWDTAGGHVDVTPEYLATARLELEEEVGIVDVDLHEVAYLYCEDPYDNGVRARRFIKIYKGVSDQAGAPGDDQEAVAIRWFEKHEIIQLVDEHPERIAEGLRRCLPYIIGVTVRV